MTPEETAWAAGLFEGEGCFVLDTRRKRPVFGLQLEMTDQDIVRRFAALAGCLAHGPALRGNNKPTFRLALYGQPAEKLTVAMLPWLGERRRERAVQLLSMPTLSHRPKEGEAQLSTQKESFTWQHSSTESRNDTKAPNRR